MDIKNLAYETDASQIKGKASKVYNPETIEEMQEIIRNNLNIVPRGGGSGLAGGAVPLDSVVIDLSKMNKIINLDISKKEIEVEAGILLDELNEELETSNLEFPVQPSSHSIATIGGMIATNAVGARAIKHGKTSNWVKSLEIVNSKGEPVVIEKSGISDIAGMEGTTGIIVKAKLKLIEKPLRTASLYAFDDFLKVMEATEKLKMLNDVSMIEFLDKKTSSMLEFDNKYHLIAEFESDRGKLKDKDYKNLIEKRDRIYPVLASVGYSLIEDPFLMLHKMPELVEYLESKNIPFFGHLGVGIIHPCFRKGDENIIKNVLELVNRARGKVTGEHGYGISKREFLDNIDKNIIKRIKERYDPEYKFNPGKIVKMEEK